MPTRKICQSFFAVVVAVVVSGCAIGPLLSHDVGRSMGDGNHDIKLMGSTGELWGFKYDYGLTDNFDIGFQWEALSAGIKLKYAWLNNQKSGMSIGTSLGTGTSFGGSYYNGALLLSYRSKYFEPFASVRYTKVESDETDLKDADTGELFVTIPSIEYDYTQAFVGTKIWFASWFGLSLEAGSFIASGDVKFDTNVFYSVALEFAF